MTRHFIKIIALATLLLALFTNTFAAPMAQTNATPVQQKGVTTLVGDPIGGSSNFPALSGDGKIIAYSWRSWGGGTDQIKIFDTTDNEYKVISKTYTGGAEGNGHSTWPTISNDGRYVAYLSAANNIDILDGNGADDIFVYDRQGNQNTRVSVNTLGIEGNDDSSRPQISGNGRFVVFISEATNLTFADTNGVKDVFVRDLVANTTQRISTAQGGNETANADYPVISDDGSQICFLTFAPLLSTDTNGSNDVYCRDILADQLYIASANSDGQAGNDNAYPPALSGDGRFVAYFSLASNLVLSDTNGVGDIFIRDLTISETIRLPINDVPGVGTFFDRLYLNHTGTQMAFTSGTPLVPQDSVNFPDAYLYDIGNNEISLLTVRTDGVQGNQGGVAGPLTATGKQVLFYSGSNNLIPGGDFNNRVYVRTLTPHSTFLPLVSR